MWAAGKRLLAKAKAQALQGGVPSIYRSFLHKGANQQGPDANGVYTGADESERSFTAFGENLPVAQAACRTGCRQDSMFTIVVNDRSAGQFMISSGRRRSV